MVGAGVLLLPGVAAGIAGPGSIVAWGFDCVVGVPLALTFAMLAARYPDAGGVATFTRRAFGEPWGAVVGWFYFIASANGMILVPLTGAYYLGAAYDLSRPLTFAAAAAIEVIAVAANLVGLRLSGRLQLLLSGGVAVVLSVAALAAIPRMSLARWEPLFPHGLLPVGQAAVLIFFAFFGWEAIAHLSAEFKKPERDILRATAWSIGIVTVLYIGVAVATIGTGLYGSAAINRVAVAAVLSSTLGVAAAVAAAAIAFIVSLGTANAFTASASRLGYALARDRSFPAMLGHLDSRGVPRAAILLIGAYSLVGLVITYTLQADAEQLILISSSLGLATYLVAMVAAYRLLPRAGQAMALVSFVMCALVFIFAGASLVIPLAVAVVAILYRRYRAQG